MQKKNIIIAIFSMLFLFAMSGVWMGVCKGDNINLETKNIKSSKDITILLDSQAPVTMLAQEQVKERGKGLIEISDAIVSPGDKSLAYIPITKDGFGHIWLMNIDGSQKRKLVNDGVKNSSPAWSPDGNKIIFSTTQYLDTGPGDSDIWVVNVDGSDLKRLTKEDSMGERQAVWSPDGKKIAFSSGEETTSRIWVMDTNGANRKKLTSGKLDVSPNWSPDGKKIVYYSIDSGSINTINVNGTVKKVIASNLSGYNVNVQWIASDEVVYSMLDRDTNSDSKIDQNDTPSFWSLNPYSGEKKKIEFKGVEVGPFNKFNWSQSRKKIVFAKEKGVKVLDLE